MMITYYAGAADAAGTTSADLNAGPLTATEVIQRLGAGNPQLSAVLTHCSLLVDGRTVGDPSEVIGSAARVDVLPPFAGG